MSICIECGERQVAIVSRQLCGRCYQKKRREGELYEIPIQERLINKYGPSIIDDLESLKTDPVTLTALGDKYGFTREYGRQLFFTVFGYRYTGFKSAKIQKRKIDKVIRLRNPVEKVIRFKRGGGCYKGAIGEALVYGVCESLGYDITSGIGHSVTYDLIINGYKCDVKTAFKTSRIGPGQEYFKFGISKKQRDCLDFLILHVAPLSVTFIIPQKICDGPMVYIPPTLERIQRNRFSEYREAWHLLMRPLRQVNSASVNMEAYHG